MQHVSIDNIVSAVYIDQRSSRKQARFYSNKVTAATIRTKGIPHESIPDGCHGIRRFCHAVAEEDVPMWEIAEAIGRGLKIPVISLSPEKGGGTFWMADHVLRLRPSGLKRKDAEETGLESDGPGTDC